MLVDTIQAELMRLQLHPVNLNVTGRDDGLVALHGSLLQYWSLPRCLDGEWLLAQLEGMRDAAGPEVVMSGLVAAYATENKTTKPPDAGTQLRLFDPQGEISATRPAGAKNDH
jgi:hypothetical protein